MNKPSQQGQALVILLVFMVIAIVLTTTAVAMTIINASGASHVEQGDQALKIAESGAENALLRLVRDPFYRGSETLTINGANATVEVSGTNPVTVVSTGTYGVFMRVVEVTAETNSEVTVISWKEIY